MEGMILDKFKEYDLYLKIKSEQIHTLCYIVEAEDNLMNIRHLSKGGLLKIIVPGDMLNESLKFLKSISNVVPLKVVEICENPGHT
ncbi:MAG: hypothetical protein PWQ77_174 [Kosmotogales bacterium]|nr:hypothetical protein [Kosmotogales bacterium]